MPDRVGVKCAPPGELALCCLSAAWRTELFSCGILWGGEPVPSADRRRATPAETRPVYTLSVAVRGKPTVPHTAPRERLPARARATRGSSVTPMDK
jgi:hypothetical protein